MYADWWYAWCLTYFMGTHKDVFIVLKKSLKWIPVVGWVGTLSSRMHDGTLLINQTGHANFQVHISCTFMGVRPD
jgi:hypothetical protein